VVVATDRAVRACVAVVTPRDELLIAAPAHSEFRYGLPGAPVHPSDAAAPCSGGAEPPERVAALRGLFVRAGVLHADGAVDPEVREAIRSAFEEDPAAGADRFEAAGLVWKTADLVPLGRHEPPPDDAMDVPVVRFALRPLPLPAYSDRPTMDRPGWPYLYLGSAEELYEEWGRVFHLAPDVVPVVRALRAGVLTEAAVRDASVGAGVYEVAPSLRVVPLRTPTLPPATHTNAFIVGSRDAVLVEPATPHRDELDRFVALVRTWEERGVRPKAILATHHHPDHVGGAAALKERLGLPLWAHRLTAERLRGVLEFERLIEDGERIELDGPEPIELRAVHTPGHAPGHLCFIDEQSRAMIAGDMVAGTGTILVEPTDGDMAVYLDSLHRMADEGPSMLLPAHGRPIVDPRAGLKRYVAHRLMREGRVLDALGAHGGPVSPADLVPAAYDDTPRAAWGIAALSVEAHLIKLEREGRARRSPGGWIAV
jgi:glyoxylase-like metal-dependent hydrolase (beta-lactamase superfamily II)